MTIHLLKMKCCALQLQTLQSAKVAQRLVRHYSWRTLHCCTLKITYEPEKLPFNKTVSLTSDFFLHRCLYSSNARPTNSRFRTIFDDDFYKEDKEKKKREDNKKKEEKKKKKTAYEDWPEVKKDLFNVIRIGIVFLGLFIVWNRHERRKPSSPSRAFQSALHKCSDSALLQEEMGKGFLVIGSTDLFALRPYKYKIYLSDGEEYMVLKLHIWSADHVKKGIAIVEFILGQEKKHWEFLHIEAKINTKPERVITVFESGKRAPEHEELKEIIDGTSDISVIDKDAEKGKRRLIDTRDRQKWPW